MQTVDPPDDGEHTNNEAVRAAHALTVEPVDYDGCAPLLVPWCGTITAGALFGFFVGIVATRGTPGDGVFGFFFGAILAGVIGVPIHLTIGAVTHLLWLTRFRVAMAGLAGALTGIASTMVIWDPDFLDLPITSALVVAALLGGGGGSLAAAMYVARSAVLQKDRPHKPLAQHPLFDVALRLTLVAGLIAGWSFVLVSIHDARKPVLIADLQTRFDDHEAEFLQIASMLEEDEQIPTIWSDGSYDTDAISRERATQYLSVMRKAGLNGSSMFSRRDEGGIRTVIAPRRGFRNGIGRTYLYTNTEPEPIVTGIEDSEAESFEPGKTVYLELGHNWYLSIERHEYID